MIVETWIWQLLRPSEAESTFGQARSGPHRLGSVHHQEAKLGERTERKRQQAWAFYQWGSVRLPWALAAIPDQRQETDRKERTKKERLSVTRQ